MVDSPGDKHDDLEGFEIAMYVMALAFAVEGEIGIP